MLIERGAGAESKFPDEAYLDAGATVVERRQVWADSDVLLKVRGPRIESEDINEVQQMREGSTLLSFLYPAQNKGVVEALAARHVTSFAMDMIPRISRAQVFDVLRLVSCRFTTVLCEGGSLWVVFRTVLWPILPVIRLFSRRRIILVDSCLGK